MTVLGLVMAVGFSAVFVLLLESHLRLRRRVAEVERLLSLDPDRKI